jgi:hypothetical protein
VGTYADGVMVFSSYAQDALHELRRVYGLKLFAVLEQWAESNGTDDVRAVVLVMALCERCV